MPITAENKAKYPKDWPAISKRIRFERAQGMCEQTLPDGSRCNAPHGELIFRDKKNPEQWRSPNGSDCGESDPDSKGVMVVLTVAHLDHEPSNCADSNLMAMCQLHHLRYDALHHGKNARRTRRKKLNTPDLFVMEA